jgi:hypothetical protein
MLDGPQGRFGRLLKISPPTGIQSPDRPARSESLYRLRYSGLRRLRVLSLFARIVGNIADRFAWRQASAVLAAIPVFHESESTRYEIIT